MSFETGLCLGITGYIIHWNESIHVEGQGAMYVDGKSHKVILLLPSDIRNALCHWGQQQWQALQQEATQ
jgi:hypothetical protein